MVVVVVVFLHGRLVVVVDDPHTGRLVVVSFLGASVVVVVVVGRVGRVGLGLLVVGDLVVVSHQGFLVVVSTDALVVVVVVGLRVVVVLGVVGLGGGLCVVVPETTTGNTSN